MKANSALLASPVVVVFLLLVLLSGCEQQKPPVVLAFGADWCEQCQMDKPGLQRLAASVTLIDAEQWPQLAAEYRVRALPTYVVVVDRREVYRTHSVEQLKRFLR